MSPIWGQTPRERFQEILSEVAKGPTPSKKIDLLTNGSYELRKVMPRQALSLSNRAIVLADRHGIKQGQAYASKGTRQLNLANYEGAITTYQKALSFNQAAGKEASMGINYESIGHCYEQLFEYDEALNNYKKNLAIQQKLKNDKGIEIAHNKVGRIYSQQKNYQEALKSFEAALVIAKKLGNQADIKKLEAAIQSCKARLQNPTASLNGETEIGALEFEEQYEIIKDSLTEARNLILAQKNQLQRKLAELSGKDTTIAENIEQIELLSKLNDSLEREKQQQKTAFILYLIIAGFGAGIILIIALFSIRNSRVRKRNNRELAGKNVELLDEKKKSDDLLLNILPEVVANELKATGKVKPKEYRHATMLFTDFKGFTRLATSMTPEELIKELNRCFEAFDDICAAYNLEKIKTIGDAYMAVAGVPQTNTKHAVSTVGAALEMQAFMQRWKKEKIAQGKPYWELRIGIHSGSVIAGVIGKHKFVYDIWGDAVNIASRMESSGEAWQVNISEGTYGLVKDHFECEHRGKIPIKHKGPVDMYFVKKKRYQ
jgi:class 3 adenylate cyclase